MAERADLTEQMLRTIAVDLLKWKHFPAWASRSGPIYGKLPGAPERWEDSMSQPAHFADLGNGSGMVRIIEAMHQRGWGCYTYLHPHEKISKVEFVSNLVPAQWGEDEWLPNAVIKAAYAALSREVSGE